jgi:hypothetical protein
MKGLWKIYDEAPPAGKTAIIILIILIMFGIAFLIWKLFKPKDAAKSSLDAASSDLHDLQNSGEQLTYSESEYHNWADSLEQAMSGLGTDEDSIAAVMKRMQSKIDVLQLIKAFGIRNYTDDKFILWNVKPLGLSAWLSLELDDSDMDKYVNSVLKKNGIDYAF